MNTQDASEKSSSALETLSLLGPDEASKLIRLWQEALETLGIASWAILYADPADDLMLRWSESEEGKKGESRALVELRTVRGRKLQLGRWSGSSPSTDVLRAGFSALTRLLEEELLSVRAPAEKNVPCRRVA